MIFEYLGILVFGAAAFTLSYHYNKRFLDWLRFQSLGTRDFIVERLSLMFVEVPPHHILIGLFSVSFGLGSLVFLAFLPNFFPGVPLAIITTIVGWKAPKPIVNFI